MIPITAAERTNIIKLVVAMFNAAPGATHLADLTVAYQANGSSLLNLAKDLALTPAYKALNPVFQTAAEFATAYLTPVGLQANTIAIDFITSKFNAGVSKGQIAFEAAAAINATTDAAFLNAKAILVNKTTVAEDYSVTLGSTQTSIATLQSAISGVTADVATVATVKAANLAGGAGNGSTFTLTAGVDNILGGAGNDTISASHTTAAPVLGGLDSVDGGAGTDTFSIAETATAANAGFALPTGMVIKNVETLNVTTNGSIGVAATAFDVSGMTGLTSFTGVAAGDGTTNTNVKAADTTAVTLTAAAAAVVTELGGNVVSVTGGKAASTITGAALTTVTVKNSAGMTIDNTDTVANGSTTAVGTTMTAVTLDAVDSDTAIKGKGLTTLTLKNATATTNEVTITNATVGHALTLNVDGSGYDATATAKTQTVTDAAVKTLTVNATGAKSNIALGTTSTALTSATITGTAALVLDLVSGSNTALVTIDGSSASGNLTLNNTAVATSIKTGSGNDTFTSTVVGTTKSTVVSGAGNDIVTLAGGLVAGSSVTLGDGNDTLLGTTVVAASTVSAVTVIDGGAGTDSVSSLLINAGNGAQFANFETISIGNATVDAALLTASTITGLSIDGSTGTGILQNVTQAQSLSVNANNGGTSSTLTFSGVTGTSDAYAISFNATTTGTTVAPTSIDAKIVSIEGIEAVTVNSGAAAGVATNAIALKDATAKTLVITGAQALNVSFDTAFGTAHATTGLSSIDGSAATGKLGINLAGTGALTAGLVVKGGSAIDTITTKAAQSATITGNGGLDNFNVALTFAATTDAATATITTITDFVKGETITFADVGTPVFTTTKLDVSAAISLDAAVALAVAGAGNGNGIVKWFNYGADTYIVADGGAGATLAAATDQIVKLTGTLDLSTSSVSAASVFTFA
jgi:hypothetical protein